VSTAYDPENDKSVRINVFPVGILMRLCPPSVQHEPAFVPSTLIPFIILNHRIIPPTNKPYVGIVNVHAPPALTQTLNSGPFSNPVNTRRPGAAVPSLCEPKLSPITGLFRTTIFISPAVNAVAGTYGADGPCTPASHDALRLYDYAAAVSTDASVVATMRLNLNMGLLDATTTMSTDTPGAIVRTGSILHLTNGPEFSLGVCPQMGGNNNTQPIGTGCLWIAGYIR